MASRLLTPVRIALLLGTFLSCLHFGNFRPLELLDMRALDYRLVQRGVQSASPEIVIVAVDDASLEQLGRWPWSRARIAELVDRLTAAGAAVIGFDIVQSEATVDRSLDGLRERIEGVDDHTWDTIRRALNQGAAEDEKLASSLQASGRTVLGYFFNFNNKTPDPEPARILSYVARSKAGKEAPKVAEAHAALANLPALSTAAREVGYFNFFPDDDGTYRRVPLAVRYQGRIAAPLSVAMLHVYRPNAALQIDFTDYGVGTVRAGPEPVPAAEDGQLLINFRGPGKTFPHVSAAEVLAGRVPAETFRAKLVLVGVTAHAVADIRVTAFDGEFPGVEIHANV